MFNFFQKASAFSIGVLIGTVYGSIVASFTSFAILGLNN